VGQKTKEVCHDGTKGKKPNGGVGPCCFKKE
jgi:hypothetical protein